MRGTDAKSLTLMLIGWWGGGNTSILAERQLEVGRTIGYPLLAEGQDESRTDTVV